MKWLNMGPWPYYVGFTTETAAFDREMRRLKIEQPEAAISVRSGRVDATTHFLRAGDKSATAIIVMPPHTRSYSKEQYAALLAHEATHVLQDMRECLGELGSEAEAYLMQMMVQEGLQTAWKSGRERRQKPV